MAKAYSLTKEEKETQILYNQSSEPVIIAGYDPHLLRQLSTYAQRHPDLCRRIDKGLYSDYAEYEVQKDRVSIRLLSPLSDERKQAAVERAKQMNLSKQMGL